MNYESKHISVTARRWWVAITIRLGSMPPACVGFGIRDREEARRRAITMAERMMMN